MRPSDSEATTPAAGDKAPVLALARLSIAGCEPFLAVVSGDRMVPAARWRSSTGEPLRGASDPATFWSQWQHNAQVLQGTVLGEPTQALADFIVHAPIAPRQIYCTIGNYRGQVVEATLDADPPRSPAALDLRRTQLLAELDERHRSGTPYAVLKPVGTVSDPSEPLCLQPDQQTLDWEVEIGAVIGRPARQVSIERALSHVAAYCTVNDITLRQRVFRTDLPAMGTDFFQAKGGPGWLPLGPWLVPASQVPDPAALRLRLWLNGKLMQDGRADDMVFTIAEQIAYLSQHVQLEPGDLVCTGSPAGFGQHHRRFLRPGDRLTAEVSGLGSQTIDMVAA